jgi:REP element-mobilizing transposase RayT
MRPLSSKEPLHLVMKANKERLKGGFRTYQRFFLIHQITKRYISRFWIKIEQISVQDDHIHLLIRASRRSNYQSFFRVFSGQIAQRLEQKGLLTNPVTDTPGAGPRGRNAWKRLWKFRPFSRVVRGYRAYKTVRDYIQLNEKEALREIRYQKRRLKGLSSGEWKELWA